MNQGFSLQLNDISEDRHSRVNHGPEHKLLWTSPNLAEGHHESECCMSIYAGISDSLLFSGLDSNGGLPLLVEVRCLERYLK